MKIETLIEGRAAFLGSDGGIWVSVPHAAGEQSD